MPPKKDQDTTPGIKLLRMFRKLMLNGRRHFQSDLAEEFQCSPQTIIRLAGEIEGVVGASLESGLENRRRWYQIRTISRSRLGLDFEELRYLAVCRDLAAPTLPEQVRNRVDDTIFNLSLLMADHGYSEREKVQRQQFSFFNKGRIDYTPHFQHIEDLLRAIEEKRVCLVRYRAAGKNESKEHRFVVKQIVGMNGALYAIGAGVTEDFISVKHFTNFAIHRIQDVTLTDKRVEFGIPEADLKTFGLLWHEPRTFRIGFKSGKVADYVRERIWADQQHLEELSDGGLILKITARSEPELMAWVRSFGDDANLLLE